MSKAGARNDASASRAKGRVKPVSESGGGMVRMLNIGYGNLVLASRVVAIVTPAASPMRRLREEASERNKLVDATMGRRTRSIFVTESDHVIRSAIHPETIAARRAPGHDGDPA